MTSKSLKFFKFEVDILDYAQEPTPEQIFMPIRSAGASPQIGEILRFCDFLLPY